MPTKVFDRKTTSGAVLGGFSDEAQKLLNNGFTPDQIARMAEIESQQRSLTIGGSMAAQLFFNTGGVLADPNLEAPILNLLLAPQDSLANRIPIRMLNLDTIKFAFLTDFDDGSEVTNDGGVCDDSPVSGDFDFVFAEFAPGRISLQSPTVEMESVIALADRGAQWVRDRLYVVGDFAGVSGVPTPEQLLNRNFLMQSVMLREMQKMSRKFNRLMSSWLWSGDTADVTQNSSDPNPNWVSWNGLQILVANDYASKAWITGTGAKASLNSVIVDWANRTVNELGGAGNAHSFWAVLQGMEHVLYQRASFQGVLPVEWGIVMRGEMWREIAKVLPFQMVGYNFNAAVAGNANLNIDNMSNNIFALSIRQQLEQNMALTINGRTYPVIIDDFMPYTAGTDATTGEATYTSDVYFMPFTVRGEQVLEWWCQDYSVLFDEFSPIPNTFDAVGWSDGGLYYNTVGYDPGTTCLVVQSRTKPSLIFRAPHLAGRITNLVAKPELTLPIAYP